MSNTQNQIERLEDELSRLKAQIVQTAILQAEKDRIEYDYQRSQNRFKTVFEQSAIGKKIINNQLQIVKVNNALLQILGYTENEMLGKLITDFSHPDFTANWKKLQRELWSTNMTSFNFDTCLIKKDGSTVWVHITTILIDDDEGKLGYTILEDISERKEIERLRDMIREQDQRQQIAETILNTQEEERRRIAEGLHNGLGQLLYGVSLSLSRVKIKQNGNQPSNEEALQYTQKLLADSIHECRRISHDLIPTVLQDHGLKEAVSDVCRQLSGNVKFNSNVQGFDESVGKFLEIAIYRIIQELMLNVVKHAEASKANINITAGEAAIQINVADNGKGFDQMHQKQEGIGLQTLRYKVKLLSGDINISSSKGKGTIVEITIPKRVN